ncbi:hypothetical protein B296_00049848 [Ensete ventricosum]|uniref:Uncharacterized protein n=1 Tax=Ensete ventricosum TaxID=4639 RepID=A0A426X887_ENSVE|nr:hypothetical protein B296_00049848 [Ensete ventricosum]
MSHPDEVTRVPKLASVVWRRGSSVPISSRPLRRKMMCPPCKKTLAELLVLGQVPPAIKSGVEMIEWKSMGHCSLVSPTHLPCHAANRLLSGALQASRRTSN